MSQEMKQTKSTLRGNVKLGDRVIAADVTYDDYLAHYAGESLEWDGEPPVYPFEGEVIAENVPYDDFLDKFDEMRVEWIDGTVIRMSPATPKHAGITGFLQLLFSNYLAFRDGGRVLTDVVIVKFSAAAKRGRAPDVIVILPDNLDIIKDRDIIGAPDLVVEVVSADSHSRDRVEKFAEYQRGGIREYWIIDPIRREALFYVLGDDGKYQSINPDDNGLYRSTVLDKLVIAPDIFWRESLPDGVETFRLVETMLNKDIG